MADVTDYILIQLLTELIKKRVWLHVELLLFSFPLFFIENLTFPVDKHTIEVKYVYLKPLKANA